MSIQHRHEQRLRALQQCFPTRPLRVRRTGHSLRLSVLMAVLVLLLGTAIGWSEYRELRRDGELLRHGVRASGQVSGSCRRSTHLLSVICTTVLDYSAEGRRYRLKHHFSYIGALDARPPLGIVRSATDPAIAAPQIALDRLAERRWLAAASATGALAIFFLAWATGHNARRFRRVYGDADGRRLLPALVQVKFRSPSWSGALNVLYVPMLPVPGKGLNTAFAADEQSPILLEGKVALAVVVEGAEHLPLLLDGDLARLDLDEHERQRLLAELED